MSLFKAQVERSASGGPFIWTIHAKSESEARQQAEAFVAEMKGLYKPETLMVKEVNG